MGLLRHSAAINFTCHLMQQKVACFKYFKLMIFGEKKLIEVKSPTVNLEWRRDSIGTAETFRCSYSPKTTSAVILKAKWRPKFVRSGQIEQDLRLSIYAHLLSIFLHEQIWIGTIPILRQQRDWVAGVRKKWQFLLTYSTIYADVRWVGGSEKVPKCADII